MNFLFILILLFVLIVLYFVVVALWRRRGRLGDRDIKYIKDYWARIMNEVKENPVKAVLDADKLLDYALGKKGLVGSLGEKLKKGGHLFSDINGVWSAHKLRNRIAHELSQIPDNEISRGLSLYKKALKDLGVKL